MRDISLWLFLFCSGCLASAFGQDTPAALAYPDESGFQRRTAPMLSRIADRPFAEKTLSRSICPDTGLPVKTWALEGETVYSPYTGRAYTQGPVGYFGPKTRDSLGRIATFGGDPLKTDLPPAMATLLLEPGQLMARTYLSIPGSMRQQYHFAAKNWARFYPLLAWCDGCRLAGAISPLGGGVPRSPPPERRPPPGKPANESAPRSGRAARIPAGG